MGRRGIRLIQRRFPGLIISGSWFHDLGLSPAFGLIFRFNLSINNHSQQVSRVTARLSSAPKIFFVVGFGWKRLHFQGWSSNSRWIWARGPQLQSCKRGIVLNESPFFAG